MCVVMAALFYAYVAVRGESLLWVNLLDFALAAAAGQTIGYRILVRQPLGPVARRLGAILLIVQIVAFLSFSFLPPHLILFRDPVTQSFGIPER